MLRMVRQVGGRQEAVDITASDLVIAGGTGRDVAGLQHRIDELAALGVKPPSGVPFFYSAFYSALPLVM